ncbi:MAG TPA: hypothetical protein RMH85_26375 [Polyangiaceae bacterium LLY-WYZ-15_(1-7)]|nr:hypothetical protein [Polyangiaceae bacterium LLY-WYZ-15_(1-7)]HJL02234.1 hypothetical protein [Polyangiaceae bacterium LLY-WYZ-15_(1-7)]HJL12030.1 hypothetical protein [Polyangiaceae bacterium LLY-WYZ-15_(1-7)]HJL20679.1 hypothetical protein [Polyangiaceae bacterium LLY-WYZ-15_(1-7)]HJL28588.1 hypothetical protein [Polyangiaceae bacterium LLY-WYZ-15_(1-7)]
MDILAFGRDNGDMVLSVDDERVRRELPDGRVEEVRWDALKKVEILSTAEGPLLEDVFFLLFAAGGGGVAVPSSLARETGLLPRLQRLPHFDHEAVIRAMTSTEPARFLCWERRR